jgi:mRNA interferase MazF
MVNPARGEIWWVEDPELGRRPGLVLTRDAVIPVLRWVLVAPLTRTVRGIPTELALDVDDGVPHPCAASFDNIRPVRGSLLTERLTTLSSERMAAACAALRVAVDC